MKEGWVNFDFLWVADSGDIRTDKEGILEDQKFWGTGNLSKVMASGWRKEGAGNRTEQTW